MRGNGGLGAIVAGAMLGATGCFLFHSPDESTEASAPDAAAPDAAPPNAAPEPVDAPAEPGPGGGCDGDAEPAVARSGTLDLLLSIDNSRSMAEEQAAVLAAIPRLIDALTAGDLDGDGSQDFPPVRDLHVGVVTGDAGLVGIQGIPRCEGLGDDGVLNDQPGETVADCRGDYSRFLAYSADADDPARTGRDLACLADLGTDGCGFEQPLNLALKALWPGAACDASSTLFLGDVNGLGQFGHGDVENAGFLRTDPADGLSVLAVIAISDEDDCSSHDTRHFTPDAYLPEGDELRDQPLNVRCFHNPQNFYGLDRHVDGLKALRPGAGHLVVFGAIVGIPQDLTAPGRLDAVDFANADARADYYAELLADPRMQPALDPDAPADAEDGVLPACSSDTARASPGRRFVELAERFGENGAVQSICAPDFTPVLRPIAAALARAEQGRP